MDAPTNPETSPASTSPVTYYRLLTALVVGIAGMMSACGKAPPPQAPAVTPPPITIVAAPEEKVKATMTIAASADVNPNGAKRPSPVVVRVYQLRTDGAFNEAFSPVLFADDRKVLGEELISRDEYVLKPGERRIIEVRLSNETRFVGAVAEFYEIADAQWRAVLPAPRQSLNIAIIGTSIVLSGN